MSSESLSFPAPALHGLPLASFVENSLRVKGLHGALAVLNATTPYRLTGVYRFDGAWCGAWRCSTGRTRT